VIVYRAFDAIPADFVLLTDELDQELWAKQGEAQKAYHGFNRLDGIHDVVLSYDGATPVGCASFKVREPGVAEVKRVFVRPSHRRQGLSRGLMAELEKKAIVQGLVVLILETSRNFAPAVGLYRSLGYSVTANYPPYVGMPESLCFRKELLGILGLDHVQVAIPRGSEAVAREFYCGRLGLPEIEKPENLKKKGGLWVKCGRHELHLGILEPFVPATKAHPGFEVRGIRALRSAWEAKAVKLVDEDVLPGAERFYVYDPFGNRLEFLEWLP